MSQDSVIMNEIDGSTRVFSELQIEISLEDLERKIQLSAKSSPILKIAEEMLAQMTGRWQAAALYQWLRCRTDKKSGICSLEKKSGEARDLILGRSVGYLKDAEYVMVACYTIGNVLDMEAAKANTEKRVLESYIIDLIGLTALGKTGDFIRKQAEEQAHILGWGVGPFLSPGSVPGWPLEEQSKIGELLPLEAISVRLQDDSCLAPLKSISAIIGIGPNYSADEVGSPCDACSKRNNCLMRNTG